MMDMGDFQFLPTEGSIKMRASQKGMYDLFVDPYDNQGARRTFSLTNKRKSLTEQREK